MGYVDEVSMTKANHILSSAGTSRLNRILRKTNSDDEDFAVAAGMEERATSAQKIEKLDDPRNPAEVSGFTARVVLPPLRVDQRSIGGTLFEEYPDNMLQETLLCVKCKSFELTGTDHISITCLENPATYAKHKRSLGLFGKGSKGRNKVHYVILARSTNRPLLSSSRSQRKTVGHNRRESAEAGYDKMFAPGVEDDDDHDDEGGDEKDDYQGMDDYIHPEREGNDDDQMRDADDPQTEGGAGNSEGTEVSSFPTLVCLTLNSDGANPDIRKLIELDQLTTVQDVTATVVQLAFQSGDTVRFDFSEDDEDKAVEAGLVKERFIWSLLQIHAMLCVSVVERSSLANNTTGKDRVLLPPLNIRNLDRAELQYVATVNSFLKSDPTLCALLDRQRELARDKEEGPTKDGVGREEKDEKSGGNVRDGMAYDLMMGNFAQRVAIFQSADERTEAEEVLNSTEWTLSLNIEESAAATAAERLSLVLQRRMRDLEAETCRRLIAWEDEKHFSMTGQAGLFSTRDTVDALSLAHLFTTLESLDRELSEMEDWLEDRVLAIKPLTDDCRDIEEENRQLEQQWKSYDLLGSEMRRLLKGLVIDQDLELILGNPASALVYDESGNIQVEESEDGVDRIYDAGKALQEATEHAEKAGGLHLRAVSERVEALAQSSDYFCTSLAQIIVTIMEQFKTEVVAASDHGKVSKQDTHSMIAKKVRDTQRKFQSSLLGYIKLIEVMALLNPKLLPAIRDAYSEMVAEGILMKKRMKGYFQALPGKNAAYLTNASKNLKDYSPYDTAGKELTVNAEDIKYALSELLPVVAREAYFTAALFGLSSKAKDGREKKRNFEAAKKSVDHSTQYFRYYIQRTCGIADYSEKDPSANFKGDPMLSLVASIHLNEAMENYIDREKKGGDHSLSLAYVRATILELRKKVDKQWVAWVEQQIEWVCTNPGVPMNGKRAGIFAAFARFPCYIDHILLCCREGRKESFTPDLANIKVVSYYLQKMATALLESLRLCAERETTDQQYGASVMQMENSYFFTQSLKNRGTEITALFSKQITKANAVCKASTDAYLGWMIKREFKSLHALFSNISKIRREVGDREVPMHVPKATFVRTLTKESNREVMKEKIAIIYSRMEKHLSEEGGLLPVAWKALVKVLYEWFGRWEKLSSQIYSFGLDPSAVDIVRIAKAAGSTNNDDPRIMGNGRLASLESRINGPASNGDRPNSLAQF